MSEPAVSSSPSGAPLAGKTVLITGGNKGLGFEMARRALLTHAARVIITSRSQVKGEEAVAALRAITDIQSGISNSQIEFFNLDLEDYQSGMRFCQQVKEQVPELDLLLCNGGVTLWNYELSKSGHERNMQVNCYTHFFIVLELLDLLRATAAKRGAPARVTFLGSYNHTQHDLKRIPIPAGCNVLDYFDSQTLTRGPNRYSNSKMVVIAFAQKLATLVPASEVIVNSACPGVVYTGITSPLPWWMQPIIWIFMKLNAVSVEEGGRRIAHAAVEVGAESHGQFFSVAGQTSGYTPFLDSETGKEFKDQLWKEIWAEGKKVDPALVAF